MKGRKSEIGGVERKKEEDRMKDIEGGKDIGGEERSQERKRRKQDDYNEGKRRRKDIGEKNDMGREE